MTRLQLALVLLAVLALLPAGTHAQDRPSRASALDALSPRARAYAATGDTLLHFETVPVANGRVDVVENVLRAAYRIHAPAPPQAATPEAAARLYLASAADSFGLDPDHLVLASLIESRYSSHVVFRQTFHGLPVYNRQVKVNLDREGRPTMVLSGYAPHLDRIDRFETTPTFPAAGVAAQVAQLMAGPVRTGEPELLAYPARTPRLVWRVLAWPEAAPGEWEVLLDARTGEPVQLINQSAHAHPGAAAPVPDGQRTAPVQAPAAARPASTPSGPARTALVDGRGLAFIPDPVTSAGVSYGDPYTDQNDAPVPELDAQRKEVVLRDLTLRDGRYYLEGPHVRIDGSVGYTTYTPPAEQSPTGFQYSRANPYFEAVMAYYHIDTSQRYVQSLDVGRPIQQGPLRVNPRGATSDNSEYLPGANYIYFGTGGVDDAEDGAVIWHEYAHALLEATTPGLISTAGEGLALHEGWGDYWAGSYLRGLIESGAVPVFDWRRLYRWDGNVGTWCGRWLDHPGRYPDQTAYTAPEGCYLPPLYQKGMLWATTLMEIYSDLGRAVTDRLNLASHAYLNAPAMLTDAAHALIQADVDLYGGAHAAALINRLGARGFVDPASYRPTLAHNPLPATEQEGGTVEVTAHAVGRSAPVDSVVVWYRTEGGAFTRLALAPRANNVYAGQLPIPASGTVFYYVEAVDELGRRTRLPEQAPNETYRFDVGPDERPPAIAHTPLRRVARAGWPAEVVATATDALGVDSVWVSYTVRDPGGAVRQEGSFRLRLVNGRYRAFFPFPAEVLQEGSVVTYRLHARDRATRPNTAVLPEADGFSFEVVLRGLLAHYDFEADDQNLQATGVWASGRPAYGLAVAHSGERVWATVPAGPYPARADSSSLSLPPLNLEGLDPVYLVFWHWYDLEHAGQAEPDGFSATRTLWDGGNVKVSTDGGQTWELLHPEGGYTGVLNAIYGNPLGGQRAFGGYSYGWRREIVRLPAASVRIRFDFGTDSDNQDAARYYAGWYLDDVTVTTEYPTDGTPPSAVLLPPAVVHRTPGQAPPQILVQVADDTGLRDVFAEYTVFAGEGQTSGRLRLAMSDSDLSLYRGTIAEPTALEPGDRIEYRLRLVDFAGNERVYPSGGEAPFRIEYRYREVLGALNEVRASGAWRQEDGAWRVAANAEAEARSSLVLAPMDLPANADELRFTMTHQYRLSGGAGGNVKLSTDGGRTWSVLAPLQGYPTTLPEGAGHALSGEAGFTGRSEGFLQTTFDLSAYAGRQVRLRIDFGAGQPLPPGEFWSIRTGDVVASTREDALETPRELALHPNFPNPFRTTTTINYTLPETLPVRMEVYDLLGRRVAVLVDEEQGPGTYTVTFDGARLASGVYLVRMLAGASQRTIRMVLAH